MDKGALWKISPRERGKNMEGEGDKRICQELPSSFRICGDGDDNLFKKTKGETPKMKSSF